MGKTTFLYSILLFIHFLFQSQAQTLFKDSCFVTCIAMSGKLKYGCMQLAKLWFVALKYHHSSRAGMLGGCIFLLQRSPPRDQTVPAWSRSSLEWLNYLRSLCEAYDQRKNARKDQLFQSHRKQAVELSRSQWNYLQSLVSCHYE